MRLIPFFILLLSGVATEQSLAHDNWQTVASPVATELRGLSVVNQKIAWASGAKGTVLRTIDGSHWQQIKVDHAQAQELDFRAIHAFDEKRAYLMSAGPGAASKLFATEDGGQHWQLLAEQQQAKGFWNAFNWRDPQHGVIFGDPLDGQFELRITEDGGKTWRLLRDSAFSALPGEGAFAASGTCLHAAANLHYFVSGGASESRVFIGDLKRATWFNRALPLPAAAPSKGAFSVLFLNTDQAVVVGGDYQQAKLPGVNAARSDDGGKSWQALNLQPAGFYSVVTAVPGSDKVVVAGGLAGISWSQDAGKNWQILSETAVNTIAFSDAQHGWAIGPKGLLLKYQGQPLR